LRFARENKLKPEKFSFPLLREVAEQKALSFRMPAPAG